MGDFNVVLYMDDRIRGNPVSMAEVKEFHECVENCGLLELPKQGSMYTWNDKHGGSRFFSKIDGIFVNSEWLDSMPDFSTTFPPEEISDHSPMKLSLPNSPKKRRKPFKYCNVWSSHPLFLERVKVGWNLSIEECQMMRIVRKMKPLKSDMSKMNGQHFRNILTKVEDDRQVLMQV